MRFFLRSSLFLWMAAVAYAQTPAASQFTVIYQPGETLEFSFEKSMLLRVTTNPNLPNNDKVPKSRSYRLMGSFTVQFPADSTRTATVQFRNFELLDWRSAESPSRLRAKLAALANRPLAATFGAAREPEISGIEPGPSGEPDSLELADLRSMLRNLLETELSDHPVSPGQHWIEKPKEADKKDFPVDSHNYYAGDREIAGRRYALLLVESGMENHSEMFEMSPELTAQGMRGRQMMSGAGAVAGLFDLQDHKVVWLHANNGVNLRVSLIRNDPDAELNAPLSLMTMDVSSDVSVRLKRPSANWDAALTTVASTIQVQPGAMGVVQPQSNESMTLGDVARRAREAKKKKEQSPQ